MGNRTELQQVILNLVVNGSDAMSEIKDRPRTLLITTSHEVAKGVQLSVHDSGMGLDPHSAEKLFDAFYTTKSQGMGMGLSISRSIIEAHHGRIWANAYDGPGATFSIFIPHRNLAGPQNVEHQQRAGGQEMLARHLRECAFDTSAPDRGQRGE